MTNKIQTLYKTINGETKEMRVNDSSLEHGLAIGWKKTKPAKQAKDNGNG